MKSKWIIAVLSCALLLNACGLVKKAAKPSAPDNQTSVIQQDKDDKSKIKENDPLSNTHISDSDILKPSRKAKSTDLPDSIVRIQEILVKTAKSKLGCRYRYNGKGPNSFDCSGFTAYVFRQAGMTLGASSRDQFRQGRALTKNDELRTGDLVFWKSRRSGSSVGHVGMVVDYDKKTGVFSFIHASSSSGIELQKSCSEYYTRNYMGARRILGESDIVSVAPTVTDSSLSEEVSEIIYHTIKSGDTLYALARKYHTSVNKICSLNGISENRILQIGQKLRIK